MDKKLYQRLRKLAEVDKRTFVLICRVADRIAKQVKACSITPYTVPLDTLETESSTAAYWEERRN